MRNLALLSLPIDTVLPWYESNLHISHHFPLKCVVDSADVRHIFQVIHIPEVSENECQIIKRELFIDSCFWFTSQFRLLNRNKLSIGLCSYTWSIGPSGRSIALVGCYSSEISIITSIPLEFARKFFLWPPIRLSNNFPVINCHWIIVNHFESFFGIRTSNRTHPYIPKCLFYVL